MHPSAAQKYKEQQKQTVVTLLKDGPKKSTDVAHALALGAERTREVLASLKKQGVVGFVKMLGDKRVWCLAAEAEELRKVQRALIKNRRAQYDLNRTARQSGRSEIVIQVDNLEHDDWPVRQSRVTQWAPIRPAAPVSIFTLAAK